MCLDKGYDYAEVRDTLKEFRFTAHIRARGEEALLGVEFLSCEEHLSIISQYVTFL